MYSLKILSLVLLAIQLMILVSGQEATTAPPPPDDTCVRNQTTTTHEAAILNQIYSEELAANASDNTPIRCHDGPLMVPHTVPGEFHIPQIYKASCDCLLCDNPWCPCIPHNMINRQECVLVYQKINNVWVRIGYRLRAYVDQQDCRCVD